MEWTARPVIILTFPSGIKNPVLVANRLLSEAQKGKLSAGRIPPWWLSWLLINVVLMWLYPLFNVDFFFGQLFSGARSTWMGSQPWNTTMPLRENGHQWVLLHWFRNMLKTEAKHNARSNLWMRRVSLCGCIILTLFFHSQSSVCLPTRGTSGRWSWQKKWTQDIIRQRKDDNQVKMWVLCYRLK